MEFFNKSPELSFDKLHFPFFEKHSLDVYLARLDKIHPQISGNKYYKLKENIRYAVNKGYKNVLSFGGPFSNHIHALAYSGLKSGLRTIGVIRSANHENSETLADAEKWGMEIQYVSREVYRLRNDLSAIKTAIDIPTKTVIIPEGGSNHLAIQGMKELQKKIQDFLDFDYICCPVGTGGTLAGLVKYASKNQKICGFSVLKGKKFLSENVKSFLEEAEHEADYDILHDYTFGGYAKYNNDLIAFIESFQEQYGIELDPIYTSKMLFGFENLVKKSFFKAKSKILLLHTGGLQGKRGFNRLNQLNL